MKPDTGPPNRLVLLILVGLIVAGGLIRFAYARANPEPFPVDAIYYLDVAESLAEGRGMTVDYVWSYVRGVPASLPVPAMGYWMPGMSLYLAPWLELLGATFAAGQLANCALGMVLILLTWWVGRELAGDGAGLLGAAFAAIDPHFVLFSTTTDAVLLQAVFVAAALLMLHKGAATDPRWLLGAGLCGGLAHLVRNDSLLLVPVALVVWVAAALRKESPVHWRHGLYFLAPYALVLAPWLLRNMVVFGSPQPPGMHRLAFLASYSDLFRLDWSPVTPSRWLQAKGGITGVLAGDAAQLWQTLRWLCLKSLGLVAIPAAYTLAFRRPRVAAAPLLLLGILLATYSFVFPELGLKGSFASTVVGLFPFLLAAGGAGLWALGEYVRKRRGPNLRTLVLGVVVVVLALQVALGTHTQMMHAYAGVAALPYNSKAETLQGFFSRQRPGDHVLLTDDPWTLHRITGRQCAQVPTDDFAAVQSLAEHFGARFIVATGSTMAALAGFEEAQQANTVSLLAEMPVPAYGETLCVLDLHKERIMAEVNAALLEAEEARQAGDYPAAISALDRAFAAADGYLTPQHIVLERLAGAHLRYGEKLEAEGALDEALRHYRRALERAPVGTDLSAVRERLQDLEN